MISGRQPRVSQSLYKCQFGPKRAPFRFSIGELLGTMALLGIAFAWPPLLFFIVPIILGASLQRMGYGALAPFVIAIGLSLIFGVLFSLYYWRYPFAQPRLLQEIRQVVTIEQLSKVEVGSTSASAAAVLSIPPAASLSWNTSSELFAIDRILQDFGNRNLTIQSSTAITPDVVASAWTAANENGLLIEGENGYPNAKQLYGYFGIGRCNDGRRIAFATLMGNEHSNDHYPYYEFVIPLDENRFEVTSSQWFFVDIAGMEGANWLAVAIVSFTFLTFPIACVTSFALAFLPKRRRRLKKESNGPAITAPAGAPSRTLL